MNVTTRTPQKLNPIKRQCFLCTVINIITYYISITRQKSKYNHVLYKNILIIIESIILCNTNVTKLNYGKDCLRKINVLKNLNNFIDDQIGLNIDLF